MWKRFRLQFQNKEEGKKLYKRGMNLREKMNVF